MDRREFIGRLPQTSLAAAAGITLLADAASVRAVPASERIAVAVVGVRGRGNTLAGALAERKDCRVAYLCNVDSALLPSRSGTLAEMQGRAPQCVQDFRRALDDKSVDAVVIATPDHWHCLAGVWACQAGKDVYVESPLSQSPWEGRKLVEIARREKRIVQTGHSSRSAAYAASAKKYIDEGKLGAVHFCRVVDQKGQNNFPAKPDAKTPKGLNWDMWSGPAPLDGYNANFHNNWHGFWRYSGGDMAVERRAPTGLGPLAPRPGASADGVQRRRPFRRPRGQRDAGHACDNLRVRQAGDGLRVDAVHALHVEGFAHGPPRRRPFRTGRIAARGSKSTAAKG